MAERAGNVLNDITKLQGDELTGGFPNRLDHQRDGPAGRVGVGDGQRDSFSPVRTAHNDELAGLPNFGYAAGFDVEPGDVRTELDLGSDGVHATGAERMIFRPQSFASVPPRQAWFAGK
jgi:hypothetical protein